MARTVMLSEEIYKDLKRLKELKNKSFSETIRDLMESQKITTGEDLKKLRGIMKDDNWDKYLDELKNGWKKWSERYA